jgi:hypothetical protein
MLNYTDKCEDEIAVFIFLCDGGRRTEKEANGDLLKSRRIFTINVKYFYRFKNIMDIV